MVPGSPARTKIRDVTQWSLYKSILPKNMVASKSDVTSAVLTANIPSHFCHDTTCGKYTTCGVKYTNAVKSMTDEYD